MMTYFKINTYTKGYHQVLFFILIILMALCYNYIDVFSKGPYSIHMWRQTDCLSITQEYYQDDLPLLEPAMLYQVGGEGKCVAEFPIVYYINASLWKWFGKSTLSFRLFTFIIVVIGLFYAYCLAKSILNDSFWAGGISLLLFTSPILVFYANNFMGNVPAIGFVFIAWYGFYQFYKNPFSDRYLMIVSLLIILVGLLRISLLYTFSFIYLYFFLELLSVCFLGKGNTILFQRKLKQAFILLVPLLFIGGWVYYASHYNRMNNSVGLFLFSIKPVWSMTWPDFLETSKMLFYHTNLPSLWLSFTGLFIIAVMALYLFFNIKKLERPYKILLLSLLIGFAFYVLFFYPNLKVHDYYYLEFIPLWFVIMLFFVKEVRKHYDVAFLKIAFLSILVVSIFYCAMKNRIRYSDQDWFVQKMSFMYSQGERDYWWWFHSDYDNHLKALETIEPKLREQGIDSDDLILSLPDPSPNISLYMMGQKGYSNFYKPELGIEGQIEAAQQEGVQYLILTDGNFVKDKEVKTKLNDFLMMEYGNVSVYDIRKLKL